MGSLWQDGEVVTRHNSTCTPTCDSAGSLWVDDGAVEVRYLKLFCFVILLLATYFSMIFMNVISPKEDAFFFKTIWFIPWKPSSFQVSHGKIIEGGKLKVVCPAGSAGEGSGGCERWRY